MQHHYFCGFARRLLLTGSQASALIALVRLPGLALSLQSHPPAHHGRFGQGVSRFPFAPMSEQRRKQRVPTSILHCTINLICGFRYHTPERQSPGSFQGEAGKSGREPQRLPTLGRPFRAGSNRDRDCDIACAHGNVCPADGDTCSADRDARSRTHTASTGRYRRRPPFRG